MHTIVVVGNSLEVLAPVLQAIRSFSRASIKVVGNNTTRSIRWSFLCSQWKYATLKKNDDDHLLQILHHICSKNSHSCIVAADCDAAHALNRLRSQLQVPLAPMPNSEQLAQFDDKWHFHQFCQQYELPSPLTYHFHSKEQLDFRTLATTLGIPFVIKPTNRAGSEGVKIIHSVSELENDILKNSDYQFTPLLAQKYIAGSDIDISLLAIHGQVKVVAVQQVSGSVIRFLSEPTLEVMAARLCKASDYEGVMHIDARIEELSGKIYLIESNPRYWASLTAALWCGVNFVQESLKHIDITNTQQNTNRLVGARAYTRYPLLRPGGLRCLTLDRGLRGRLVRLSVIDPWKISRLIMGVSKQLMRHVRTTLPGLKHH
jgi:predicted ATP-grasp superfamily ATP-dependent carboligase